MRRVLLSISDDSFYKKTKQIMHSMNQLAYETTIIATSGTVEPSVQKTHEEMFLEISSQIDTLLTEISNNYNGSKEISTMLSSCEEAFMKQVSEKWAAIVDKPSNFIVQEFKDTSSSRIYSYDTALSMIAFLKNVYDAIVHPNDLSQEKIDQIVAKCQHYGSEQSFDMNAGKPMVNMGYASLEHVEDVILSYKELFSQLDKHQLNEVIDHYKKHALQLVSEKQTLDASFDNTKIATFATKNGTMSKYNSLLTKSVYCQFLNKLIAGAVLITEQVNKTVANLIDASYNARVNKPTQDITENMGGALIPTVIEEMPVAVEGFFGKLVDRLKSYYKDTEFVFDTPEAAENFMEFIRKHLSDEEVKRYLKGRKWSLPSGADAAKVRKTIEAKLPALAAMCIKFCKATTHQELWKYSINKNLDIPEIKDLEKLLTDVGIKPTFYHIDRVTGKEICDGSADNVPSLLMHDTYYSAFKFVDAKFPTIGAYINWWIPESCKRRIPSVEVGATDIASLEVLLKDAIDMKAFINKTDILEYLPMGDAFDKNLSGINDTAERDKTIVSYWRSCIWADLMVSVIGVYAFCIYMPYVIIKDVKRYA